MKRRTSICLLVASVLLVAIESVVRLATPARGEVEVTNLGVTPILGLVLSFDGSRIVAGDIPPGESASVRLSGSGKGVLSLSFTQAGNPTSGYMISDFDPDSMSRDGLRQVIQIKPNEVVKYMDDAVASTPLERLRRWLFGWAAIDTTPLP